jgi:WD40 repeat protein
VGEHLKVFAHAGFFVLPGIGAKLRLCVGLARFACPILAEFAPIPGSTVQRPGVRSARLRPCALKVQQTGPSRKDLPMSRRKKRNLVAISSLAFVLLTALFSCVRSTGPRAGEDRPMALAGHTFPVQALAFGPDGITLTSFACYLSSLKGVERVVWDLERGQPIAKHLENPGALRGLVLASRGRTLAAAGEDRGVWVWDIDRSHEWRRLGEQRYPIGVLAISDDGAQLATDDFQCDVTLWDVSSSRPNTWSLRGAEPIVALAFAPGGRALAWGCLDHTIRLWDVATGEERTVLRGHTHRVQAVAYSPDGRMLASGDLDGVVKIWDVATWKERFSQEATADKVYRNQLSALVFSPDGQMLAVAFDRVVQLWDVATSQLVVRLEGHEGKVACLAFSPDGTRLATGGHDQTVRLWDVARYRSLQPEKPEPNRSREL